MLRSLRHIAQSPKLLDPRKRAAVMGMDWVGRFFLWPWSLAARRRRPAMGAQRRILLMRVDGVGDFCMSTAIFSALRRAYPQARIDLLCSTLARPLAEPFVDRGMIDNLYTLPLSGRRPRQVRELIRQLRSNRYDVAADLRGDFRNVLIAWLAGIPRRFGMGYSGFNYLLTRALPAEEVHQTEEVRRMAELLGVSDPPRQPALELTERDRAFARDWLDRNKVDSTRPLVAFHLTAGMPARLWPLERFIEVARHLFAAHRARVLVVGAPNDRDVAAAFSAALQEPALVAAGACSLSQAAALVERCDLFIGTDSGPAHVASAVGCPIVVLFGPGNLKVMRPYSDATRVVKSPRPCEPHCHNTVCAVPQRHCLTAITAADVSAAADEALRAGRPHWTPAAVVEIAAGN